MNKNQQGPRCKHGELTVSVQAPDAREVFLAGTFNNWDPKATPMKRSEGGDWVYTLDLSPGRYEYKFVIDGQWCCEPGCDKPHDGCPRCVPNELGTMNRLLEVKGLGRQPAARHVPA